MCRPIRAVLPACNARRLHFSSFHSTTVPTARRFGRQIVERSKNTSVSSRCRDSSNISTQCGSRPFEFRTISRLFRSTTQCGAHKKTRPSRGIRRWRQLAVDGSTNRSRPPGMQCAAPLPGEMKYHHAPQAQSDAYQLQRRR